MNVLEPLHAHAAAAAAAAGSKFTFAVSYDRYIPIADCKFNPTILSSLARNATDLLGLGSILSVGT